MSKNEGQSPCLSLTNDKITKFRKQNMEHKKESKEENIIQNRSGCK
jgi:hypothetical protein